MSNYDEGILIYLKRIILLSLSHRFDSFALANMLYDPSRILRLLHARWQRPKNEMLYKQMFFSSFLLLIPFFFICNSNSTHKYFQRYELDITENYSYILFVLLLRLCFLFILSLLSFLASIFDLDRIDNTFRLAKQIVYYCNWIILLQCRNIFNSKLRNNIENNY